MTGDRADRPMPSTALLNQDPLATDGDSEVGGSARVLARVFAALDRAGTSYCLLHGYENLSEPLGSDIDVMIPADVRPARIAALLDRERTRIGAEVVRCL